MRTLYIEGVAIHGGPESCVGDPVRAQRSVDRGRVGGAIEPRNSNEFRVPTSFSRVEGNTAGDVIASRWRALRGRRSQARTTSSVRENREISWSPAQLLVMPRLGWFAGWQTDTGRAVRGTLRR
jgi:hypothetical protein